MGKRELGAGQDKLSGEGLLEAHFYCSSVEIRLEKPYGP